MSKSTNRRQGWRRKAGAGRGVQPVGRQVVESLTELVGALRKGDKLHERFTMRTVELDLEPRAFGPAEIRALRDRLMASQGVFARLLAVSVRTVQAWETGTAPSPMARRLLETIEHDPGKWLEALRGTAPTRRRAG